MNSFVECLLMVRMLLFRLLHYINNNNNKVCLYKRFTYETDNCLLFVEVLLFYFNGLKENYENSTVYYSRKCPVNFELVTIAKQFIKKSKVWFFFLEPQIEIN